MDFSNAGWSPMTSPSPFGPIGLGRPKLTLTLDELLALINSTLVQQQQVQQQATIHHQTKAKQQQLTSIVANKQHCTISNSSNSSSSISSSSSRSSNSSSCQSSTTGTTNPTSLINLVKSPRLHVSNIPFRYRREHLAKMFSYFGSIIDSEVIFNERGSKGFGFVSFARVEDAERAKRAFDGIFIDSRKIEVNYATPKPRKSKRSTSLSSTFL